MSFCSKLVRAVIVLPFSAGHAQKERSDGLVTHDGSIAGVVLLTSAVAILCEVLIFGTSDTVEESIHVNIFFIILDAFSCFAVFSCVVIFIYASSRNDTIKTNKHHNVCDTIKLRFLWLFSFACIAYALINFAYHIDCLKRSLPLRHIGESISYDVIFVVYCLVQTVFLTHFSHYHFINNIGIYYGLLILFMTNIAVICRVFVSSYSDVHDYRRNSSTLTINKSMCQHNSSIFEIVDKTAFLEPVFCEYSLLAILFITEMWPRTQSTERREPLLQSNGSTENDISVPGINILSDDLGYLLPRKESTKMEETNRRSKKFINISVGILLMIPAFVLYAITVFHVKSTGFAFYVYLSVEATIFLLFFFKCFYDMQNQCRPKTGHIEMTTNDYLLIICSVGAIAYYTIKLISYVFPVTSSTTDAVSIYNLVIVIIGTYFQTVFILQMKNYQKSKHIASWISIEYTCLLLSVENLCTWAFDTLISSQNTFGSDVAYRFYGQESWVLLYTFVFPFVIFYRFICFISFYGLYDSLK